MTYNIQQNTLPVFIFIQIKAVSKFWLFTPMPIIQRPQRSWLLENLKLDMCTILEHKQRNCSSQTLKASKVFKTVEESASCFSQLSLFLFLATCRSHRQLTQLHYLMAGFTLISNLKMPIPSKSVAERHNCKKPMATFHITWKKLQLVSSVHGTGFHEDILIHSYNVLRASLLCSTPISPLCSSLQFPRVASTLIPLIYTILFIYIKYRIQKFKKITFSF